MKKLIISSLFCLLTIVGFANAQTSSQIRQKLGKTTSETFQPEPNLTVKADYDDDGEVCVIQMSGRYFDILKLAEELIPQSLRGRELEPPKSTMPAANCCSASVYEYEKVRMHTFISGSGGSLKFIFKGRECQEKSVASKSFPAIDGSLLVSSNSAKVLPFQERKIKETNVREYYGKYETTQPAVITFLPLPELTPEALAEYSPGEMVVEVVLTAGGEITNLVFRGYLKKGMRDRVSVAVKKIKFTPAQLDNRPVSQKVTLKYGIKKCDDGKICAYAFEFVD
jgi:hypothetical protein